MIFLFSFIYLLFFVLVFNLMHSVVFLSHLFLYLMMFTMPNWVLSQFKTLPLYLFSVVKSAKKQPTFMSIIYPISIRCSYKHIWKQTLSVCQLYFSSSTCANPCLADFGITNQMCKFYQISFYKSMLVNKCLHFSKIVH